MPFPSHHISVQACLLYAGSMSICLQLSIHARELLTARHVLVVFYYLLFSFTQCMSHLRMFQNEGPTIPLGIDNVGRKLKGFQALSWDMHHTWYQDVSTPRPAYQGSASVFRYGRHIAKIANVCVLLILKPVATVASRMRHRTKREQRVFENRNQRTRDENDVLRASIQYVRNNTWNGERIWNVQLWRQYENRADSCVMFSMIQCYIVTSWLWLCQCNSSTECLPSNQEFSPCCNIFQPPSKCQCTTVRD